MFPISLHRASIALFLAVAFVAAGCAGAPEGVLEPIGDTVPGATALPILVATTRAPTEQPGVLYSGERGGEVDLNEIVVSLPPDKARAIGEVQWPRRLPPDPAREFATVSVSPVQGPQQAEAWYRANRASSGRLLVFVHGFNNRYESAVYRFAQIVHDSKADATPLLFTWPSRGSVFAYGYDKESANYSRTALEQLLRRAADNPGITEITVLAHSMGTWLTVESLRQMAIRDGAVTSKIQNVILAAPDLDIDVFRQQLADMGEKKPRFTVFVSRDDRALTLSRRISGNVDRLGQVDINDPSTRDVLEKEGILVLDLSALQAGDRLNHSKFAESPEVVRLLGDRLIAGQTVTDQDVGLGAEIGAVALTAAGTVGSAASLAVSVPIAVVDPGTRATLADQTDRLGQQVGNTVVGVTSVDRLSGGQPQRCRANPQACRSQ